MVSRINYLKLLVCETKGEYVNVLVVVCTANI